MEREKSLTAACLLFFAFSIAAPLSPAEAADPAPQGRGRGSPAEPAPSGEKGGAPENPDRAAAAPLAVIAVDARGRERIDTPLSVSLEGLDFPLDEGIRLVEVTSGTDRPVAARVEAGSAPRLWWILDGRTAPGARRFFVLRRGKPSAPAEGGSPGPGPGGGEGRRPGVKAADDGRSLVLSVGPAPVLRYNHAVVPPPVGANPLYARSGFIHPLWSPSGAVLTRIHPPDHLHHVGLWNPYAKTRFEGREVDFWNLGKGEGTVRFDRFLSVSGGPVYGSFRALMEHVDLTAPGGERAALTEVWDVRVWNLGGGGKGSFLVDFTSILRCASESPVLLEKYRYGGFGFRAAASFDKGDYLTSEGRTRADGQGTRARWCIVHGPTDRGPAGALFMNHPQNHDSPERMRIWTGRPEIFFSFCPIQAEEWNLEPGRDYVLRYRMALFDGTLAPAAAERFYGDFADPPRAVIYATGVPGGDPDEKRGIEKNRGEKP